MRLILVLLSLAFVMLHQLESCAGKYLNTQHDEVQREKSAAERALATSQLSGKREIPSFVEELDSNKDGVLEIHEMLKIMTNQEVEEFLKTADFNGDSAVSIVELELVSTAFEKLQQEEAKEAELLPAK